MKKTAAGICILLAAGMITACQGKAAETTAAATTAAETTAVETTAQVTTAAETTVVETTAPETETSEDSTDAELKTVSGEVKAVGMSAVTIVTEDGEEMSFLKEDTEVDIADGIQEGIFVTITYQENEEGLIAVFITDAIEP